MPAYGGTGDSKPKANDLPVIGAILSLTHILSKSANLGALGQREATYPSAACSTSLWFLETRKDRRIEYAGKHFRFCTKCLDFVHDATVVFGLAKGGGRKKIEGV